MAAYTRLNNTTNAETAMAEAVRRLTASSWNPLCWGDPLDGLSPPDQKSVLCKIATDMKVSTLMYALFYVKEGYVANITKLDEKKISWWGDLVIRAQSFVNSKAEDLYVDQSGDAAKQLQQSKCEDLAKIFSAFSSLRVASASGSTPEEQLHVKRALALCALSHGVTYRRPVTTSNTLYDQTTEERKTPSVPIIGREEIITDIFKTWQSGQLGSAREHPFLVGDTRIGKTMITREVARRIASGNVSANCPSEIKHVLRTNAGELFAQSLGQSGDQNQIFRRILKDAVKKADTTVTVIDEGQVLFVNTHADTWGQNIKSLLDSTQPPNLKYVIFATTRAEYDKCIAKNVDTSIAARFRVIDVPPLDKKIVTDVLLQHLAVNATEFKVNFEDLDYLVTETERLFQDPSLVRRQSVVQTCVEIIQRVIYLGRARIDVVLDGPKAELDLANDAIRRDKVTNPNQQASINTQSQDLLKRRDAAQQAFNNKQAELERFKFVTKNMQEVSEEVRKLLLSIDQIVDRTDPNKVLNAQKKKLLQLLVMTILPMLKTTCNSLGEGLGNVHLLDKVLIKQGIAEAFGVDSTTLT